METRQRGARLFWLARKAGATLVVSMVSVLWGVGPAAAATPPYAPDVQSKGACQPGPDAVCTLTLYDAKGRIVTGGQITDAPFAAYAQANQLDLRGGDTKAFLVGATPMIRTPSSDWPNELMSPATTYPVAAAPAPLNHSGSPGDGLPMVNLAVSRPLAQLIKNQANSDESDDGYKGLYQLRLFTSGGGRQAGTNYYEADIVVTGQTWKQVYPGAASPSGNAPGSWVVEGGLVVVVALLVGGLLVRRRRRSSPQA